MSTCIAKYTPTKNTQCKSISLEARVNVAAEIYMVSYHYFWTKFMRELQLEISPHFLALQQVRLRTYANRAIRRRSINISVSFIPDCTEKLNVKYVPLPI